MKRSHHDISSSHSTKISDNNVCIKEEDNGNDLKPSRKKIAPLLSIVKHEHDTDEKELLSKDEESKRQQIEAEEHPFMKAHFPNESDKSKMSYHVYLHSVNNTSFIAKYGEVKFSKDHAIFFDTFFDTSSSPKKPSIGLMPKTSFILLTGIPGSGKSHVLRMLINYLRFIQQPLPTPPKPKESKKAVVGNNNSSSSCNFIEENSIQSAKKREEQEERKKKKAEEDEQKLVRKQRIVLAAMTGAAAARLGDDACTIHSFIGAKNVKSLSDTIDAFKPSVVVGVNESHSQRSSGNGVQKVSYPYLNASSVPKISNCRYLFIDEVSMMTPTFFNNMIQIFSNLGSKIAKIVLIGDFMQLEPIVDVSSSVSSSLLKGMMIHQSPLFQQYVSTGKMKIVVLKQSFRQSEEDKKFAKLLSDVRFANLSDESLSMMRSRIMDFDTFTSEVSSNPLTSKKPINILCTLKTEVEKRNMQYISSCIDSSNKGDDCENINRKRVFRYMAFFVASKRIKCKFLQKSITDSKYASAICDYEDEIRIADEEERDQEEENEFNDDIVKKRIDDNDNNGEYTGQEKQAYFQKMRKIPPNALNIARRINKKMNFRSSHINVRDFDGHMTSSSSSHVYQNGGNNNNNNNNNNNDNTVSGTMSRLKENMSSWQCKRDDLNVVLYADKDVGLNAKIIPKLLSESSSCFGRGFAACSLVVGCTVSFTRTICQSRGIFNGNEGIVVDFLTVEDFMSYKGSSQLSSGSCINTAHEESTTLEIKKKTMTCEKIHPESSNATNTDDLQFDNDNNNNDYVFGCANDKGMMNTENVNELFPHILVKTLSGFYVHVLLLPYFNEVIITSDKEKASNRNTTLELNKRIIEKDGGSQSNAMERWDIARRMSHIESNQNVILGNTSNGDDEYAMNDECSIISVALPCVAKVAITVHSAQGLTLGNVWVDTMRCKKMPKGTFYVILSRVERLENIAWSSDPSSLIECHMPSKRFYEQHEIESFESKS